VVSTLLPLIDKLAVERGERHGKVFHLKISTNELVGLLGMKSNASTHRSIKAFVEMHYPGTKVEPLGFDAAGGFRLHIKIWSK
jgi:hypothetical protein